MYNNQKNKNINISLFGAMPDTGNLGVSALCFSTIAGIKKRIDNCNLTVFGLNNKIIKNKYTLSDAVYDYKSIGAIYSKRFYKRNNLWNMRISGFLGGLGNPGIKIVSNSNCTLDISQGDSFTDMYGSKRFSVVTLPKLIALQQNSPLILLPQTYGPFNSERSYRIAKNIVCNATSAWARDERSFKTLREMLGNKYDKNRHHSGIDVAFSLPKAKPKKPLSSKIQKWLRDNKDIPTIGLNISGLIFNDPNGAITRYKFKADYQKVIKDFIRLILVKTDANILLIPHVFAPKGNYESDPDANNKVYNELFNISDNRLEIVPPEYNESEMKSIISNCDWFCGTRMHSTIAGLSTGVATAAIAYSIKTEGVFETCGQGAHVVDPRFLSTEDVVKALYDSFKQYKNTKNDLSNKLPNIIRRAESQMDKISEMCLS